MTRTHRTIVKVASALTLVGVLSGCAIDEAGNATSDPKDVAKYAASVSASRAATVAKTVSSVCQQWDDNYETRRAKTRATTNFTKTSGWTWAGILPLVSAEISAINTEADALSALITQAAVKAALATTLSTYRDSLTAYGAALQADTNARGSEDNTWPKSNPAGRTLASSITEVQSVCAE
jgi:hypothetical protein